MNYLAAQTLRLDEPMTPELFRYRVEAETPRKAAEKLLFAKGVIPPTGGLFWVHVAADAPWNLHPNGLPMSVTAFECRAEPKAQNDG